MISKALLPSLIISLFLCGGRAVAFCDNEGRKIITTTKNADGVVIETSEQCLPPPDDLDSSTKDWIFTGISIMDASVRLGVGFYPLLIGLGIISRVVKGKLA